MLKRPFRRYVRPEGLPLLMLIEKYDLKLELEETSEDEDSGSDTTTNSELDSDESEPDEEIYHIRMI